MTRITFRLMNQFAFYLLIGVISISIVGCQDLAVENENAPDRAIAFAQTGDVVNLARGTFEDYWTAIQTCNAGAFFYSTIADENSSSWANWAMRDMSSEPRIAWDNSPTYSSAGVVRNPWFWNYAGISNTNDVLLAISNAEEQESVDNNIFTRDESEDAQDTARLKAFVKMNQGLMHGSLSLIYDQAFVFDETVDLENDELELRPYAEVNQEAIRILEEARAIASANDFTLEGWIWGLTLTSQEMVRLINSFIARFMVQVARDEAARAAVDWNQVMGLADSGIQTDFAPNDTQPGAVYDCLKFYGQNGTIWSRADYRTIGPADESGGYAAWLAAPLQSRFVFDVITSDRRIVGSDSDPTVDGSDFEYQGTNGPFPAARGTYHYSSHNHKRYQYYNTNNTVGLMPHILVTEMDLYKAEGLLRTGGSTAQVAEILNKTRVGRGMMNPASGSDPAGSPSDDQSHLDSASLWAKLKHERRIETFQTAAGLAYFDKRGLGDLVQGTPIHFPVPGRELETLGLQSYTFGGVGGTGGAPRPFLEDTDSYYPR